MHGFEIDAHDPLADAAEAAELYGLRLMAGLAEARGYDAIVGAVAHDEYRAFTAETFTRLGARGALIADVKGMWRHIELPEGMRRWEL